jgi:hypothetical protein
MLSYAEHGKFRAQTQERLTRFGAFSALISLWIGPRDGRERNGRSWNAQWLFSASAVH